MARPRCPPFAIFVLDNHSYNDLYSCTHGFSYVIYIHLIIQLIVGMNMCHDEEKGCSAQDLVKVESCRGENLLSNDIKYVMIG